MRRRLWWILILSALVSCIFTFMLIFALNIPYQYGLLIAIFLLAVLLIDRYGRRISIKEPMKFRKQLLVTLASCANFTGVFVLRLFWNLEFHNVLITVLVLSFLAGLLIEEIEKSIFCVCFSLVVGGIMTSLIYVFPLLVQGEDLLIVQNFLWQAIQSVAQVFIVALVVAFVAAISASILSDVLG